jgi:hypothetical protein
MVVNKSREGGRLRSMGTYPAAAGAVAGALPAVAMMDRRRSLNLLRERRWSKWVGSCRLTAESEIFWVVGLTAPRSLMRGASSWTGAGLKAADKTRGGVQPLRGADLQLSLSSTSTVGPSSNCAQVYRYTPPGRDWTVLLMDDKNGVHAMQSSGRNEERSICWKFARNRA